MKRRSIACAFLLTAVVALVAISAAASEAPACQPSAETAITDAALPADGTAQTRSGDGPGGAEAQGTCQASCGDGTAVTCSGSSCSAYDSNCGSGFRGYCTGSTSGTKYCPACQGCTASTTCQGGPSISCTGTSVCREIQDCWVSCDGVVTDCYPPPQYPCPFPL